MMKAISRLPEGYREIYSVNLQKDKKIALLINIIGIAIMAALMVPMHFSVPITSLFDMSEGMGMYWFRLGIMLLLMVFYMDIRLYKLSIIFGLIIVLSFVHHNLQIRLVSSLLLLNLWQYSMQLFLLHFHLYNLLY